MYEPFFCTGGWAMYTIQKMSHDTVQRSVANRECLYIVVVIRMLICVRILSPLSEEPAAVSGLSRSACVSMSIYSIVHIHKSEKASIQICFCRYISSKSVFQLIITLSDNVTWLLLAHVFIFIYAYVYTHTLRKTYAESSIIVLKTRLLICRHHDFRTIY